jgi:arylsulfatase A-like enzyme
MRSGPSCFDACQAVLLVSLALLSGCGGETEPAREAPVWSTLADELIPTRGGPPVAVRRFVSARGRTFRLIAEDDAFWVETTLKRADWRFHSELARGAWVANVAMAGIGRPPGGGPERRLFSDTSEYRHQPPEKHRHRWDIEPGGFAIFGGHVRLDLDAGSAPPALAQVRVFAGPLSRGGARVAGTRYSGDGVRLWPGERLERRGDFPAGSTLRFATVVEPVLTDASEQQAPVLFRVRLDGATLYETAQAAGRPSAYWHRVPLPAAGGTGVHLAFEVEGALAYASFVTPTIGPGEIGSAGHRPWDGERPNIVLFLADTFRADNLEAYGDDLELTPHLNRLASQSLLFRRAWSVGTYTLPAHASMFSGVYPHQVGIVGTGRALPQQLRTIAELLSEHGYRTGAITDSVVVTRKYGLDQGFEWFDEHLSDFASTRRRVLSFLDADDGRPVFLFIHTYRTHIPYEVSERTRRQSGVELGIPSESFWELERTRVRLDRITDPGPDERADLAAAVAGIHGLYRGAVADLDRSFAELHEDLLASGLFDRGYLIFTSDHGEAMDEHGSFYHRGPVWEEQSRVPLFIVGPGLEPGGVDHAASLVDLPPTVAALAGLEPDDSWLGRSLLSLEADRPAFVFQCKAGEPGTLAIIEGSHKLIGAEDPEPLGRGEFLRAFDLAADPGEQYNRIAAPGDWPTELAGRLGKAAAELLVPIVGAEEAELDDAALEKLRSLGYLGD